MLPGLEMMACPNLAVPAEVMHHIVNVESGSNPYAIGVVGGRLVRQPQNLDEALATVQMLEAKGYNYSLGVAQVNRANLGKYGLDSYQKAFTTCQNLAAGSQILANCYHSSGGDWGKSFSCYYSGNFVTGYRDGYVQKVYDSINRDMSIAARNKMVAAEPIPLTTTSAAQRDASKIVTPIAANGGAYRVAIRSTVLDTIANAAVSRVAAPAVQAFAANQSGEATSNTPPTATAPATTDSNSVFVPQVHGPNDQVTAPSVQATAQATAAPPTVDRADLRREGSDGAFVF